MIDFESELRQRLHRLADQAPTEVMLPDEIRLTGGTLPQPRRARRWLSLGVPIAVLTAGTGFTIAANNASQENAGGAETPTAAVLAFVAAAEQEDVLGALDIIDPREYRAVRAVLEGAESDAERIGFISDSFSLGGIDGLSLEVSDLELHEESVTEGVTAVVVDRGAVTTNFDPVAFAWSDQLRALTGNPSTPAAATNDLQSVELLSTVITVRHDNRWYVSLSYSALDTVRRTNDWERRLSGREVSPVGFATPQEAATAFYEAFVSVDIDRLLELGAPGEMTSFVDYFDTLFPDAEAAMERARSAGFQANLSSLDISVSGDGPVRQGSAAAFVIDAQVPAEWFFDYSSGAAPDSVRMEKTADGCVTATGAAFDRTSQNVQTDPTPVDPSRMGPGMYRSCGRDVSRFSLSQWSVIVFGVRPLATELPTVVLAESDGAWYVSPVGTIAAGISEAWRQTESLTDLSSPFGMFIYGFFPQEIPPLLMGKVAAEVPVECSPLVRFDNDIVIDVDLGVDVEVARACARVLDVYFVED